MQTDEAGRVRLSVREGQVLRVLCDFHADHTTKAIAASLGVSESTAAGYIDELNQRLGTRSKQRLGLWALHHPLAMQGEWCWPVIHRMGCKCGKGLCAVLADAA
jgi:DNA-binding NarL/FixJ family response regulator